MKQLSTTRNLMFEQLKEISEEIDESKAKKMVEGIIETLKENNITYNQAYKILRLAEFTLEKMSQCLSL